MGSRQIDKPALGKEFVWPAKMVIAPPPAFAFTPLSQYRAQTDSYPSVQRGECALMAVFEVFKPAVDDRINFLNNPFHAVAIGAPRFGTYCIPEFLHTLWTWTARYLVSPYLESVPKKIKVLTFVHVDNTGLFRMQR